MFSFYFRIFQYDIVNFGPERIIKQFILVPQLRRKAIDFYSISAKLSFRHEKPNNFCSSPAWMTSGQDHDLSFPSMHHARAAGIFPRQERTFSHVQSAGSANRWETRNNKWYFNQTAWSEWKDSVKQDR